MSVRKLNETVRKTLDGHRLRQLQWRVRGAFDKTALVEGISLEEIRELKPWAASKGTFLSQGGQPLRIMFIAPWFDYGKKKRGLSYEQTHFATTLQSLGYQVSCFDFLNLAHRYNSRDMNRMLREATLRLRPDLAFFVLFGEEIEPESLLFIRELGVPTFNWFCDDQWRYEDFSRIWAPRFDWVATTSSVAEGKYLKEGHSNVLKTQWGFSPTLFSFATNSVRKDIDVLFVGQPHGDRRRTIKQMEDRGISVRTFGHGWPQGKVTFSEMLSLFRRSKIVLGLSNDSRGTSVQVKGRDFEVPASGAFYLTTHNPELVPYFDVGSEIVTYSSVEELIERAMFYLVQHEERETIAAKGKERCWMEHSYGHRFQPLFAAMGFSLRDDSVNA